MAEHKKEIPMETLLCLLLSATKHTYLSIHPFQTTTSVSVLTWQQTKQSILYLIATSTSGEFRGLSKSAWLCWNASTGRCLEGILINAWFTPTGSFQCKLVFSLSYFRMFELRTLLPAINLHNLCRKLTAGACAHVCCLSVSIKRSLYALVIVRVYSILGMWNKWHHGSFALMLSSCFTKEVWLTWL